MYPSALGLGTRKSCPESNGSYRVRLSSRVRDPVVSGLKWKPKALRSMCTMPQQRAAASLFLIPWGYQDVAAWNWPDAD
jgi:hypothetical protein